MKKIAMIVPSLLLAGCLFGCGNKDVDPFVIENADSFNKAVSFAGTKYLQAARMLVNYSGIAMFTYVENYMSPNISYRFDRYTYDDTVNDPFQCYVAKKDDGKYWSYSKTGKEDWQIDYEAREDDFRTPQNEGEYIKYILDLGKVNYDLIKDKYNKECQAYYFKVTNESGDEYDVTMSFYNNRLTYFSYCSYSEDYIQTQLGVLSYTYGSITPELPDIPQP